MDTNKKCIRCNKIQNIEEFYKNKNCKKTGRTNICRRCIMNSMKRKNDPNYRFCEICKQYKELNAFDDNKILITVKCIDCYNINNNQSSILCC